jgi:hypothetical protein
MPGASGPQSDHHNGSGMLPLLLLSLLKEAHLAAHSDSISFRH